MASRMSSLSDRAVVACFNPLGIERVCGARERRKARCPYDRGRKRVAVVVVVPSDGGRHGLVRVDQQLTLAVAWVVHADRQCLVAPGLARRCACGPVSSVGMGASGFGRSRTGRTAGGTRYVASATQSTNESTVPSRASTWASYHQSSLRTVRCQTSARRVPSSNCSLPGARRRRCTVTTIQPW